MITIKNASQIAKMREAGALLHEVLEQLKGKIEPGITTKELDRYAEKLIRGYGAVPSFLNYEGYPASICASVDSQVVHGIPNESTVLREGQIISIDSGLILDGWQSDSAFTVGVGNVSPENQKLINVTEECFFKGVRKALNGNHLGDIGHAVQTYAEGFGYGVIQPVIYDKAATIAPPRSATLALSFVMAMNYLAVMVCPFIVDLFRHLFGTHSDRFPFFFNAALVLALTLVTFRRRDDFILGLDESYYKN